MTKEYSILSNGYLLLFQHNENWLEAFRINTIAPAKIAEAFAKNVANSSKKIIANMSSIFGSIHEKNTPGEYIYCSSKAALNMVTKILSCELKDKGITVIALHPGWVKTKMGGENAPLTPNESITKLKNSIALSSAE